MEKYKTLNLKLRQENNIQSDQVRFDEVDRSWTGSEPVANRQRTGSTPEVTENAI